MTHLVHETSPLNRPVLRNRIKIGMAAAIALLSLGMLSGKALQAQDPQAGAGPNKEGHCAQTFLPELRKRRTRRPHSEPIG